MKHELNTKEFLNKLLKDLETRLDEKNSWGKNEAKLAVKDVILQTVLDMVRDTSQS